MKRESPWVGLMLSVACLLRFFPLAKQSFWMDEAWTVWMGKHSISEMLQILRTDNHPPLSYLFYRFWGQLGHGDFFYRIPGALCGVVNCFLAYRIGELLVGRRIGLATGLFWAVCAMALDRECQVRMYPMATTWSLLATLYFWKAYNGKTRYGWIPYLVFGTLSLSTHYYTSFIILAQLSFLIWERKWKKSLWITPFFLAICAPFIQFFLGQLAGKVDVLFPQLTWAELLRHLAVMSGLDQPFVQIDALKSVLGFIEVIFCMVGTFRLCKDKERLSFLVWLTAVPVFVPFFISHFTQHHILVNRCFIFFAPYFFMLFFAGLLSLPKLTGRFLYSVVLLLNVGFWVLMMSGPLYQRQNWRAVSALLRKSTQAGDVVFVEQPGGIFALWYYWQEAFGIRIEPNINPETKLPQRRITILDDFRKGNQALWYPVYGPISFPIVRAMTQSSKRQWLVLCEETMGDPERIIPTWFGKTRKLLKVYEFQNVRSDDTIRVFLFTK